MPSWVRKETVNLILHEVCNYFCIVARSFIGLLTTCGLLYPGAPIPVSQVYERYKNSSTSGSAKSELPFGELKYRVEKGDLNHEDLSLEEKWILKFSRHPKIDFAGIWDTVGALGIPFGNIDGISSSALKWHDTRLSCILKRAVHALAIDEHRRSFLPDLWTVCTEKALDFAPEDLEEHSNIEQRWFVGCHSNIGGGYKNDPLAQVSKYCRAQRCPMSLVIDVADKEREAAFSLPALS